MQPLSSSVDSPAVPMTALIPQQVGPADLSTPASSLRFDRTVSRHLVHRASVSEVFLTDALSVDSRSFVVGAQLPRGHSFYNDGPSGRYDLMLLSEALRQAAVYTAHTAYEVPLGNAFIFRKLDLQITDTDALVIGDRPGQASMLLEVNYRRSSSDRPSSMRFDTQVSIEGRPVCSGRGSLAFVPQTLYLGLRAASRGAKNLPAMPLLPGACSAGSAPALAGRLPPEYVGRWSSSNVVLGAGVVESADQLRFPVLVDTAHPVLFDHPLDHVPGMLTLEAARQAGIVAAARLRGLPTSELVLTRCVADMTDFAELDAPLHVTATPGPVREDEQGRRSCSVVLEVAHEQRVATLMIELTQCR